MLSAIMLSVTYYLSLCWVLLCWMSWWWVSWCPVRHCEVENVSVLELKSVQRFECIWRRLKMFSKLRFEIRTNWFNQFLPYLITIKIGLNWMFNLVISSVWSFKIFQIELSFAIALKMHKQQKMRVIYLFFVADLTSSDCWTYID